MGPSRAAASALPEIQGTAAGAQAEAARVLLVDDNPVIRRTLARILHRAGHDVCESSSGQEALVLVASQAFDLVVSDVNMPNMDGFELLRLVRDADPTLPVLLVSGDPGLDSPRTPMESEAFEYLAKPFSSDDFAASIVRAFEERRRRVEAGRPSHTVSVQRSR